MSSVFDEIAELYDRARPAYPPEVVDALVSASGLTCGGRVLEVGPGTGQLTLPLARGGCAVTAVELGPRLAALARRKLAPYPAAEIVVADFARWPLPPEPFDALVSATAWHWIDAGVRTERAARALRPGGRLSLIVTHHVAGGTEEFFAEVQSLYERWDPAAVPGERLREPEAIPTDPAGRGDLADLAASADFAAPVVRRFAREVTYTARQYTDVLRTYSGTLRLGGDRREGLLADIHDLIEAGHGGRVVKRYLHEVVTAERR
ncbi:methyltransferase type 11 [Streptomyces spiroverticillatus]|uniref:Methyltransferase type 11 n=1 Tax=Streptomyces finlayi TaxID=67296 RepID=A0A918X382_9ACTN|nr:class I SAM-dependent methyltransferase [Streptomyces finlayi]GHA26439.1 methyltransferase type 11 [Streptomyces spiroverticillatus]GHD07948.1 methyltransferase type 11 [Streptomyces finlayi]